MLMDNNTYQDMAIRCVQCGEEFVFTAGEQAFYEEKGFTNEPQRCPECRKARKNSRRNFDIQNYVLEKGTNLESSILYIPTLNEIMPPIKVVNDIKIINNSLLEKASKKPSIIHELSPRQFEEMVCELLFKQGYNVTLTQKTRDGGKDIIVVENSFLGGFLIYVECKKYRPDRPIGVRLIRELYGTISAKNATAGMLVTSSYFSRDAIAFQEEIKHRMNLLDFERLVKKIQEVCS